ncbi:bifunctional acetate--CoA ligase family protein/GNAT family N-acetyltransferase [Cupriavidus pinatubonensis]|uniref:Peptidyl-lysine N-acetyltransferase Pat n=1 Tax=Cupriavidus pinatubonensis TaxID=248026 RepID=A0ABN7Y225_9BURK|nr:bifunctional acetate--CoA ligase family protein/GNAT family N-acetyltransferase [Cupriavidus pinatubonensis]CAG9166471.1 Peptidyl-lysine N-acetyltransferase Pat [Cupriavidus pinatubonensis]
MTIRNLDALFRPRSVALIGATLRPHSVGATVLANLSAGAFAGQLYLVNPKYATLAGQPCYARVGALPAPPDLAVLCTPAPTIPGLIAELGAAGTRAAIVLTSGFEGPEDSAGGAMRQAILDSARPHLLRILGPNCVGLIASGIGLNASFALGTARQGKLAFATQSGALATAVLDWSRSRQIGFSHFISLGNSADVDAADVLDYLASDAETQAILLYVEAIRHGAKFMSAARAAARNKPVLIVKGGRSAQAARAAASHTGAMAGADDVYDAAIRRAGMLRVDSTEGLFDAVEMLARMRGLRGERLAILTNGGGAGVMATDALADAGGTLTRLSDQTLARLDAVLPATWPRANPVDIIGDAPVERYLQAYAILCEASEVDAVLMIHAPTAIVPAAEIAAELVSAPSGGKPLLTAWLGADAVQQARRLCQHAGVPTFDAPERAVRGFLQACDYHRNQQLLMRTPPADGTYTPDKDRVRTIIGNALRAGRALLTEPEAKSVLAAYGVPVVATRTAASVDEAVDQATRIGYPVALKILSPDITHKSAAGGVALDLADAAAVRSAGSAMLERIWQQAPEARVEGFTVQPMVRHGDGFELIVGAATDPVFGPVLLFGHGGVNTERIGDHAVALPPLDALLAQDLVSRTRIGRLLEGWHGHSGVDGDGLLQVLVQISRLVCDIPEISELDINPLLASATGVIALDARIAVKVAASGTRPRLAIQPYPEALEECVEQEGRTVVLRPVRPADEAAYQAYFRQLTPEDIHARYFCTFREPVHSQLARLTQIDYTREMAFIATTTDACGQTSILGEVRAVADPDNVQAEFGIAVRSDCKGQGLGKLLLEKMIRYARAKGIGALVGCTMSHNQPMLTLARACGFTASAAAGGDGVILHLALGEDDAAAPA